MSQQGPQQQQRQLELDSTARVQTAAASAPVQGGAVCVWDAFGDFWCEGAGGSTPPPASSYLRQTLNQGSGLIYEGFCGCGADLPASN